MSDKIKTLAWLDSPTAATGFGVVAKNILKPLHDTGRFEIQQLAINYRGQFLNRDDVPWQLSPAKIYNPEDPHGCEMFIKLIHDGDYDMVFICNDLHVTNLISGALRTVLDTKKTTNKKIPKVIYYYPVDCHVMQEHSGMLDVAHKVVAYNNHGIAETLKVKPNLEGKIGKIHHGTDVKVFKPFSKDIQNQLKQKYLRTDPDTFLFINVNRNSQRKQIARTIYLFNEFKKVNPKSMLYLHTAAVDTSLDLNVAVRDLGLSTQTDVIFPVNYSPGNGYPESVLNEFYNMADCYITTHLGEGWGLSVTEAMAAGVPVIAPNNTSMPEILGANNQRGFMYPCKDTLYIDNSGYRACGLKEDILTQMNKIHDLWKQGKHKYDLPEVSEARNWVELNSWDLISNQWLAIIDQVLAEQELLTKPGIGALA